MRSFGFSLPMALVLLTGCAVASLHSVASTGPSPLVSLQQPQGVGGVTVSVRWPTYRAQAIPLSSTVLDLELRDAQDAKVATASIARPAATASLTAVPIGDYVLTAIARSGSTAVASATASVRILANRSVPAPLVLAPLLPPRLDSIHPTSGPPDTAIALYGANLAPPPGGTFSVTVDGRPVPGSMLQPGSSVVYLIGLPDWASESAQIALSVDGIAIPSAQARSFTSQVIDHLALSPSDAELSTYGRQAFTATAYRDAAGQHPLSGVSFSWSLEDVVPVPVFTGGPPEAPPFSLSSGYFQANEATGSATVVVTAGGRRATASVRVTTIGTPPPPPLP